MSNELRSAWCEAESHVVLQNKGVAKGCKDGFMLGKSAQLLFYFVT